MIGNEYTAEFHIRNLHSTMEYSEDRREDIGKHDDDDNAMNLMLGAFTYYTHTHDHV